MNKLLVIGYWLSGRCRGGFRFGCLILHLSAGLSVMAQEEVPVPVDPIAAAFEALRAGQLPEAEIQLEAISNPPAKFFMKACIEQAQGDPTRAIETIAELIVLYPNDADWTAKSELMSVALYIQLDMLNAADVTARQIQRIYDGTAIATRATALRSQIDQLKNETEEKGSIK